MSDLSKTDDYKEQKQLLSKNWLLTPRIQPQIVEGLVNYKAFILKQFKVGYKRLSYASFYSNKIKIVMEILKKEHKEKSLIYVVKKCAFLHSFLSQGCITALITSQDVELIVKYINEVIQIDIPKLSQSKQSTQTPRNSIQKLYDYIRGKSESRRNQKSNSKLKMQNTNDKGAVKQLSYKVLLPLCSYFLKISQDFELYSQILRNKIAASQQEQVRWKIMNYLGNLCSIITEFNRLAKYYKEDLAGCWVLLYFIMSIDITIYARIVGQSLAAKSQQWHEKIVLMEKISKISKSHKAELKTALENHHFLQLVKQIQLILQYKQKLLYLYFNSQLKHYLMYFQKPELVIKKSRYTELFQFILNCAAQINPKISIKRPEQLRDRDCKDFQVRKMGQNIKKRIHSQPNQLISTSTLQSTSRDRLPTQKATEQKVKCFMAKESEVPNAARQNNFISQAKSRAMGK